MKIPKVIEEKEVRASHILCRIQTKDDPESEKEALEKANKAMERIKAGEDFNKLATELSEDPSAKTNQGDLGYFAFSRMVKPFAEKAFSMKIGEISEPVKTNFGYHIIKVIDIREPASLAVQAEIADSVEKFISTAESLKDFSEKYKYISYQETNEFREGGYIPQIGKVEDAANFIFDTNNKLNELSSRYENDKWFFWFKILNRIPERLKEFDEVKKQVENKYKKELKENMAEKDAKRYANKIKNVNDFDKYFSSDSLNSEYNAQVSNQFGISDIIDNKIGKNEDLSKTIFNSKIDDFSSVVPLERKGFIIYKVTQVAKYVEKEFEENYDDIKLQLIEKKKNEYLNQWYSDLFQNASVIDNRDKIFRPREEKTEE